MTCAVGCECQPSFFSCAPKLTPGMSFSITRQVMPFGPVLAGADHGHIESLAPPPEMNCLGAVETT
jgi:hypothetical protein